MPRAPVAISTRRRSDLRSGPSGELRRNITFREEKAGGAAVIAAATIHQQKFERGPWCQPSKAGDGAILGKTNRRCLASARTINGEHHPQS
jgi:hypothetical protein